MSHPVSSRLNVGRHRCWSLTTTPSPPLQIIGTLNRIIHVPVSSWSSWSQAQSRVFYLLVFPHSCACVRVCVYTIYGYSSALWDCSMHHQASLCSVLTVYGKKQKNKKKNEALYLLNTNLLTDSCKLAQLRPTKRMILFKCMCALDWILLNGPVHVEQEAPVSFISPLIHLKQSVVRQGKSHVCSGVGRNHLMSPRVGSPRPA